MNQHEYLAYLDKEIEKYALLEKGQKNVQKSVKELAQTWSRCHKQMLADARTVAATYTAKGSSASAPVYSATPTARTDVKYGPPLSREDDFRKWIAQAQQASDMTRMMFGSTINAIGQGISTQLVDGTFEWRDAWKAVIKQMVAAAAQMLIIQGLMAAMTGGTSLLGGGASAMLIPGFFHRGGKVPRHHIGVLSRNEHPAILERGEFVLRKEAVRGIGAEKLEAMNRTGQAPANTFNVSVNVTAGQSENPRQLAQRIANPLIEILRREAGRGVRIF